MESKHTPGPWVLSTLTQGYEVCTIYGVSPQPTEDRCGQSWIYIRPETMFINGEWHWPDGEEQLANASLIAAAPELLEALIQAEQCVDELCRGQDPANQCWVVLGEVRAAIAKATGK